MTEFTPGPWSAYKGIVWTSKDDIVADCNGTIFDPPEDDANARLIAAAPDLLSALGMLVKMIEDDDWTTVELDEAREAIAKAEGSDEG